MNPTVYGIPNRDSVKKSRTWLSERGLDYCFHDFKKSGVPEDALDRWLTRCDWQTLVNRKGTTWRQLPESTRLATTDAASARQLMLSQPSVIKRPVIDWPDGRTTVGYTPEHWPA